MAGRGPAPAANRVRRNKDTIPTTTVTADGELRGPALPLDIDIAWHKQTVRWWDTWRRSPQSSTFTDTDWDFLLDTALMHHCMWEKNQWTLAAEVRLRAAKFGATPDDRMRLRMKVDRPEKPKPAKPEPAKPDDQRTRLKIVS